MGRNQHTGFSGFYGFTCSGHVRSHYGQAAGLGLGKNTGQAFPQRRQHQQVQSSHQTGNIPARMWQVSEGIYKSVPVAGFLQVKGRTEQYRGTLQLIMDACRPYAAEKVTMADYLPATEYDVEQMWSELLEILWAVKDKHIRLLIKKLAEDRELVAKFKRAPAAMQMHHPFLGGLLEHTLNVARAARALLPLYPKINADLVLAGAFLHYIGKTD